jgi:hypothetical protein
VQKYARTLSAVARAEMSLWPVVDALVKELEVGPGGSVKNGQYEELEKTLAAKGFRAWKVRRLQQFYAIGAWVNLTARPSDFRRYPVEWVIEARSKAKSDHARALEILAEAKTKRDIRPDKLKISAAEVIEALREEHVRADFLDSPEGLAELARLNRESDVERSKVEGDLPDPPSVTSQFWKTVQDMDLLHEGVEQYGLLDLPSDPEAHESALRMNRKGGEIAAAFMEAKVEDRLQREEA